MLRWQHVFPILLVSMLATPVFGGVWSGGGGKLLMDGRNPWFVFNTETVRYCVQIDERNFGLEAPRVKALIRESLDYWKSEFAAGDGGSADTGMQTFVLTDCAADIDVTFQFGVLTPEQRDYLGRPNEYIGVAVRTDYDPVRLKGKGFLYFSPEKGELGLTAKHLIANPWSVSDGNLLLYALVHELGHVFGFGHGDVPYMMAEDFPERMLVKRNADANARWHPTFPEVFAFRHKSAQGCRDHRLPLYRKLFDLPEDHVCFRVQVDTSGITVESKRDEETVEYQVVGKAPFSGFGGLLRLQMPLRLYATSAQTVFDLGGAEDLITLGPRVVIENRRAKYRSLSGRVERDFTADLVPGNVTLSTALDGLVIPDLFNPVLPDR